MVVKVGDLVRGHYPGDMSGRTLLRGVITEVDGPDVEVVWDDGTKSTGPLEAYLNTSRTMADDYWELV